ncbi:hypothetical protein H8S33_15825 [Ornithinibacillus sp. BX22]|uniref:Uncharacterized protein n=1 Tax=Ornithinibacillus hominis TaxID=2763055 RepID=A0A923L845_9BACI|nr:MULTISPECIES: hypothetical protein [Ornithinibacillus]MBC5638266.1 hypothetical protein [Ornithinibacillus hominis]
MNLIVFATIQGDKTVDNEKIHTEEIGENEKKIEEKPKWLEMTLLGK